MPDNSKLVLHSGANRATLAEVGTVPTPPATQTWFPVPHTVFLDTIRQPLMDAGYAIRQEEYGLWGGGLRLFALWLVEAVGAAALATHPDYQLAIGLRNSHDQTFPAAMVVGSRIFVCDNMAFSGEIKVTRKHTRNILRDLAPLSATAVGRIGGVAARQQQRLLAYQDAAITDRDAHDFLIRALDARVIPNADIQKVLRCWREPTHEAFQPRTAWSLFNAFTEVAKGGPVLDLPNRTIRLHGLMDQLAGVADAANTIQTAEMVATGPLGQPGLN